MTQTCPTHRTRRDRCPGILRPWKADDGLLLRLRLVGGRVDTDVLHTLGEVATRYGNGRVLLTNRANLQLRALPDDGTGHVPAEVLELIRTTGLVDHPEHDLVRNIMVSPQSGVAAGRADLRPVAAELDRLIIGSSSLATLPGKFVFVLDDRGDLRYHECDLGLVALDATTAQVRLDEQFGEVVALDEAAARLAALAEDFVARRGTDVDAPWHLREMDVFPFPTRAADPRVGAPLPALPFGDVPGGHHVEVGPEGFEASRLDELVGRASQVVVTPWYGLFVADGRPADA